MLAISEIFYSLQGEGPTMGCPSVFIRTAGCNLNCGIEPGTGSKWKCDTWNIMTQTKLKLNSEDLVKEVLNVVPVRYVINHGKGLHIIFTGGEPLLQEIAIAGAIDYLKEVFTLSYFEVETNGTLSINELSTRIHQFNISPKLSSSGVPLTKRAIHKNFFYNPNTFLIFKFVIANGEDLKEAKNLIKDFPPDIRDNIYLMPAMETIEQGKEIKKLVWKMCCDEGFKMTLRSQIEVFDKKAGV
jgi:6-pyruvoyltetrahydropterin 2'-reductase